MEKMITVYSADSCPWCTKLKEYLKGKNIEFTEKEVDKDQAAAMEMIKKSGQQGIPVTDINGKIIIGFDREAIDSEIAS